VIRIISVQPARHHEPEDGVTKELQTLIRLEAGLRGFVQIGAMNQGLLKKGAITELGP
jgi:hypothetical protein